MTELSKDQAEVLKGIEAATEAAEDGTDMPPCESSRESDGYAEGDGVEWWVDALHKFALVRLLVATPDDENGNVMVSMSSKSATRLARDILAVVAHVEDVKEENKFDEYDRLAAIAVERGWYVRWDREGGVLGFREDRAAQPGRWVECDKDHPDAIPDVERVQRETS